MPISSGIFEPGPCPLNWKLLTGQLTAAPSHVFRPPHPRIRSHCRRRRRPRADAARRARRSRGSSRRPSPSAVADALNATTETTAVSREATRSFRCAPGPGSTTRSTCCRVAGPAARAAAAARRRRLSRFGRSGANGACARPPDAFPILGASSSRAASFTRRSGRRAPRHRPVRRRARPREPRRSARFATSCGRSGSGCGRRSISSSAARTRPSTCRSRSSPSATAATC